MRTIGNGIGLFVIWAGCFACFCPALAAEELSGADKRMLEDLIDHPLVDPMGASRVRIKAVVRTVWASSAEVEREGWVKPGGKDEKARIYFTGGDSVAMPPEKEPVKIDFISGCQKRYGAPTAEQEAKEEGGRDDVFAQMHRTAIGGAGGEEDDLTIAAWLHRLGQDELAGKALAKARARVKNEKADPVESLKAELAWSAFAGMVHAYMVRADDEALDYGTRLLAIKSDKEYPRAQLIYDELKRRQKKGTFGKTPSTQPAKGYEAWPVDKKIAFWIDSLEEVDARQWGQPGGIDLADDPRVAALIALGDPAMPALIDTIEKDRRLTRSVHFWRDFSHDRTVLGVREAALAAVMSILRVSVFEPVSTGDTFTGRGEDAAKKMVVTLRAYWKKYGKLPFDERMMNILTDPKASLDAKREAAENLASLGDKRTLGTMVWTSRTENTHQGPNAAVNKFKDPTTASAILAAMDRDTAHSDSYFSSLVRLGDRRIAPELARRSQSAGDGSMRRKWAFAALGLGDSRPFDTFADDFAAGKIALPAGDPKNQDNGYSPADQEFRGIVGMLIRAGSDRASRALFALTDPKHPLHDLALRRVVKDDPGGASETPLFRHPYWIALLRPLLDETRPTGGQYSIEKETMSYKYDRGTSSQGVPSFLSDPNNRRDHADERQCDAVAEKYGKLIMGVPVCHPLLKDNDQRLARLREIIDRFKGNFRLLTTGEREALELPFWETPLVADIKPLGRAAAEEDVKAGRALFNLPAGAKVADLKLPAIAFRKEDPDKEHPAAMLIVQAEIDAGGEVFYGALGKNEMGKIPGNDLVRIKSIQDIKRPEAEK